VIADRLRELAKRTRAAARSPKFERPLLVLAAALFVGGFVIAVRTVPDAEVDVRWPLLLAAGLVGVPLTIAANAAEYAATGEVVGHRVPRWSALRIAVLSSAANLLPVPGAVLVRARALNQLGTPYRQAFTATAVVGVAWMGATGVLAGVLLAAGGEGRAGAIFFVAGAVLVAAVARGRPAPLVFRILTVEAATVAVGGLRYYLVLRGLGFDVDPGQAVALTVGAVVASAIGIFPGGLGLRELVAAGISPLVDLPAAVGLLAVAVDRLIGLPLLAALSLAFATRWADPESGPEPPGPPRREAG